MWRPWAKSPSSNKSDKNNSNNNTPSISSPSQKSIFRCSSFKDIETLYLDQDDDQHPQHQQHQQYPCYYNNNNNNYKGLDNSPTKHRQQNHNQPPTPTRRLSVFHRVRTANALLRQWGSTRSDPEESSRVVVYCTSLRVVRPTFEACRSVLSVLQGFRVAVDERDLTMDVGFITELQERLGLPRDTKTVPQLPRVFINGRYVGGAEEVLRLHEIGDLKKLVEGIPQAASGACGTCGGFRFVVCSECSGSHKIYFSDKVGFRTCGTCNENGLVRCPQCLRQKNDNNSRRHQQQQQRNG